MRSFVRPLSSRAALLGALLCLPFFSLRAGYDLESLEGAEAKVAAVAAKAAPSVVALTHGMRTGMASGSGVIIGKNGLILTAAHVLADAKIVDVTFPDGKTTKAKVLGADHERDVALALITEPGDYPFMELGEANTLKPGEMVVALGHPGGFDPKRQAPVRFGRVFDAKSGGLIQTDCTLAGGDSGGALFDLEGKVVGVHHAVGAGMSSNLDAPASAVRKSFSRMVTGDRWGQKTRKPAKNFTSDDELSGLNVNKFREKLAEDGLKSDGKLALDPDKVAARLIDAGMQAEKVKSMSAEQILAFMQKVVGDGKIAPTNQGPRSSDTSGKKEEDAKTGAADLAGLDLEKFRQRLVAEAMKKNGQLEVTPEFLAKILGECGLDEDRARSMKPADFARVVKEALKSAGAVGFGNAFSPIAPEIIEQDDEIVEAMKPSFAKVAPSIVSLLDGDKTVAMGTIVRENGFILTKHSEIAKPKGELKVKTADGRVLPAREVQSFEEHDLALVKIDADHLPPIDFALRDETLRPGKFLFTPGNQAERPMTAMGVVSTPIRSLKESGGFLGVVLADENNHVKIIDVISNSPAGKAGLQKDDLVLTFDNKAIGKTTDLTDSVRALQPESKVQLKYRRGQEEKIAEVTLGDRSKSVKPRERRSSRLNIGTEVSDRRSGFPVIFQHDQPLKPSECGSILIDLHGAVIGVNVARDSRIGTYAIPVKTVADLLQDVDFPALEKVNERSPATQADDL